MGKLIACSIDLSKIDKSKIKTVDKDGKPFKNGAKYYDILISERDEPDQYQFTHSVQQGQTKEERDAKVKTVYLGNGKVIWSSEPKPAQQQYMSDPPAQEPQSFGNDDLPF